MQLIYSYSESGYNDSRGTSSLAGNNFPPGSQVNVHAQVRPVDLHANNAYTVDTEHILTQITFAPSHTRDQL